MSTRRLSIYPNSQSFEDNLFELQRNFTSLSKNLHELDSINDSLLTFNKNFAVFLQGLRLNSECFEFPEAPNADSYKLLRRPATPPPALPPPPPPQIPSVKDHDMEMDEQMSAILRPSVDKRQSKKRVVINAAGSKRRKPVFQTRRVTDLLAPRFQGHPHKAIIER
ncbi:hypothetical protein GGI22_002454, partial [Coemansia erecta]